jgi:hypothetical protein
MCLVLSPFNTLYPFDPNCGICFQRSCALTRFVSIGMCDYRLAQDLKVDVFSNNNFAIPVADFCKNSKICSLSNCFGWSSVCFGSIETSKLSVSV